MISQLQVSIPLWALVHLPVIVTLSTAAFTPNGWVHSILYVLFENAMGIVKLGAVIAGAQSLQQRSSQTLSMTCQVLTVYLQCKREPSAAADRTSATGGQPLTGRRPALHLLIATCPFPVQACWT